MKQVVFILLLAMAFSLSASSLPEFPFVTVTGSSEQKVKPDKAVISFYLTTFNEKSALAYSALEEATKQTLTVLKNNNVPGAAITSYEIDKSIKRERDNNYNELSILGYELTRSFHVELSSLDSYQQILKKLHELDHLTNIDSEFDYSKREEVEVELIAAAADDARRRAGLMAKGLGVNLGEVFAFNDSGSFSSFFATFGLNHTGRAERAFRAAPPQQQLYFLPQDILISKTVNVIYKIGD